MHCLCFSGKKTQLYKWFVKLKTHSEQAWQPLDFCLHWRGSITKICIPKLLFFFWLHHMAYSILVDLSSDQDWTPSPLAETHGVLTTGPQRKKSPKQSLEMKRTKAGLSNQIFRWHYFHLGKKGKLKESGRRESSANII